MRPRTQTFVTKFTLTRALSEFTRIKRFDFKICLAKLWFIYKSHTFVYLMTLCKVYSESSFRTVCSVTTVQNYSAVYIQFRVVGQENLSFVFVFDDTASYLESRQLRQLKKIVGN